jgi:succinate-acetate transporter protein
LTVNDDRPAAPVAGIADPAPLGLAGFALTTFLLSAANAGWMKNTGTGAAFLGYAFAYGGLGQLLAGMWEFRNRNVFGATAFSTYGAFWLGLGIWALKVAPAPAGASPVATLAHAVAAQHDLGWILLAFAIFNTYMLIWSSQVNLAVFTVFLTLELTEIFLFIGGFQVTAANVLTIPPNGIIKVGGYIGVVTALAAWYASAAGVANGMGGRLRVPVGKPLLGPR